MGIKSPADFAYLVNLVEARLRYDITSLARSFQFLFDIFCAGISSPISMLTKALEDGLLYFVLFISNLQRKIMFEFSISSTDENSSPPPRKKTQIISLKKVTSTPIIAMKEKEIKVVTALPVPTVAMSRGLYSSVRKTNSQVIVASASPVSIVNKSTPSQPRKWRKTLFRTVGLCLAVVALAPASRNQILSLDLNSVKNSLGKIRFGAAARFFSEKKNNLKARVTRAYKNKFRRIKSTQVLPIYVEDGVLTLQGKGFSEVSVGCPFFTQVHPMK